jgi:hypothetical protein
LFFVSQAANAAKHHELLKRWALFHAFFLDPHTVGHVERGQLRHARSDRIESIHLELASNCHPVNYDDLAHQVYFLHKPDLTISYRSAVETFAALDPRSLNLVCLWLFPFDRGIRDMNWQLMSGVYLQIASLVTILEVLIGHPPNCTENRACATCGKQLPHRADSESAYRKRFIESLPANAATKEQYAELIDVAYHKVRHSTVHDGVFPTASFVLKESEHEIYDVPRSVSEFPVDATALTNLLISLRDMTRYLLLDRIFGYRFFPFLPPMHSKRFNC